MDEMQTFPAERTAVVTGGASRRGIGRAVSGRLAASGWAVAVLDLDAAATEDLAQELHDLHGVPTLGLRVDIRREVEVDAAITTIEQQMPPIVGLANVAGKSDPTPFHELTADVWDTILEVNLRGTFLVTHRIVPGMTRRGIGRVVSVSSVSAQRGGGTYSKVPYSAAKAGVLGLTRALAREVGHQGVTVNAVSPGPIDTDIMGGPLTDQRRAELVTELVVGRIGTVDDVAALICFLMSADAGFITGATYNINGGLIID